MSALLSLVILLAGCRPSEDESPLIQGDGLPARAPGVVLMGLLAPDDLSVEGAVRGDFSVDLDQPDDARELFRYQLMDAEGQLLYEHTERGPGIVRDFLDYYGEMSGMDILAALPDFGSFPFKVPLLDAGVSVRLQLRNDDGEYQDYGSYDLADIDSDLLEPSDVVVDFETLHQGGPSENSWDLVLVGDGYTADQMDEWRQDAEDMALEILDTEPFRSLQGRINIHRVDAVSHESGASFDCIDECVWRDTAFTTVFPLEFVNMVLGTDYRTEPLFQLYQADVVRAVSAVPWDQVLVVANTSHDGGMAIHFATVARGSGSWTAVGTHELAHIAGLLGDEYQADECILTPALGLPLNIADDLDPLPWEAWVEFGTPIPTREGGGFDDAVGAFQGAYNCDQLYRPMATCHMRESSSSSGFCPVCTEQIVRRMFRFSDVVEDVLEEAQGDRVNLEVKAQEGAVLRWSVDGTEVSSSSSVEIDLGDYDGGDHTLLLEAEWETPMVRTDGGDLHETRTWTW